MSELNQGQEQAIPEAVMSEAWPIEHQIAAAIIEKRYSMTDTAEAIARALLAAELRGREAQKEADAKHKLRFATWDGYDLKCPDALYAIGDARLVWVNEGDLVHLEMAGIATAIRNS